MRAQVITHHTGRGVIRRIPHNREIRVIDGLPYNAARARKLKARAVFVAAAVRAGRNRARGRHNARTRKRASAIVGDGRLMCIIRIRRNGEI